MLLAYSVDIAAPSLPLPFCTLVDSTSWTLGDDCAWASAVRLPTNLFFGCFREAFAWGVPLESPMLAPEYAV